MGSAITYFCPGSGVGGSGALRVEVRSCPVCPPRGPTISYWPETGAFDPGVNVSLLISILLCGRDSRTAVKGYGGEASASPLPNANLRFHEKTEGTDAALPRVKARTIGPGYIRRKDVFVAGRGGRIRLAHGDHPCPAQDFRLTELESNGKIAPSMRSA